MEDEKGGGWSVLPSNTCDYSMSQKSIMVNYGHYGVFLKNHIQLINVC